MSRSSYLAGVATLVILLLSSALGVQWVEVVVGVDPNAAPSAAVAPYGDDVVSSSGAITPPPPTPPTPEFMPVPLDYVYLFDNGTSSHVAPWYGNLMTAVRFQALYLASEINKTGTIVQIGLFKNCSAGSYNTFNNTSVKLCHTSVTSLTTNWATNYDGNTPVWVWHGDLRRGCADAGVYDTLDLQTNFNYNGTSNLIVEVLWSGRTDTVGVPSYASVVSGNRRAWNWHDTTSNPLSADTFAHSCRLGFLGVNDVGVTQITAPAGLFCTCDTIQPLTCMVSNFGTANQAGVPVTCHMRDSADGALIYNRTVTVDVASGQTVTVDFPLGPGDVAPRGRNTRVYDTCFTSLATDELRANDTARSSISVNSMADVTLSYNDGATGLNGCYSWTSPNYTTAVRFPGPCSVSKIAVGLMGFTSGWRGPYPCTCKVRLNDGANGMPGTEVWVSQETLYSAGWPSDYINHIVIDPPAVVTSDSFFVTWKPQVVADPFPSFDWDAPRDVGDDFSTMPGSEVFGPLAIGPQTDAAGDLIMNAYYGGFLHDVAVGSINVPPEVVDSNTTFTPAVTFKNAGLKSRPGSAVAFWITDTGGHKISTASDNAPGLNPGETYTATFPPAVTPKPTDYMDSAVIACSGHDADHTNDTLEKALFVRYYDVLCQIVRPMLYEMPGIVPVSVRLTNKGNVPARADSVRVTISDGYNSFTTGISLAPGETKLVYMPVPWVRPDGPSLVANAWITCSPDMFHPNDSIWRLLWGDDNSGWAEKLPLPATPSGKAIRDGGCMAYDASQELLYASKGNKTGDFYAYAAAVPTTWTNLAGIPLGAEGKQVYKGSVICSDGAGHMYLTKGNNTVGFWEYDGVQNTWTQKTNVPTGPSRKKVKQGAGLAWATKAGVGSYVYLLKGYRNEFYRYDPGTNTWKQLLDAPIGASNHIKWDAGSWLVADADAGNKLYAFKGKYHEFYAYDTDADTWTRPLTPMPIPGTAGNKKARDGSAAACYNGKIYAFKGGNTTEFWRYFPPGDTWKKLDDIPLIGMTGARRKVKAGGALAPFPGMGLFAFKGNKSLEFWNYTPYDVAGAQPGRDGVAAASTQIGALSFAIAPNPLAGGLATVRYSLPKAGLATLAVFDVAGRTVLTQTLAAGRTGTASLDLRKFEAGVYLVKVTTDGFSSTQKLVVQR